MKKSRVVFEDEVRRQSSTALVYEDVSLKTQDVKLLKGPYWLNDQIIAFYFQYLESSKYAHFAHLFLFVSPQMTQILKLGEIEDSKTHMDQLNANAKKLLFFPVNDNELSSAGTYLWVIWVFTGGTHWSLIVYSRVEDTFFSFDSMNNFNNTAANQVIHSLKKILMCRWAEVSQHQSAQQTNSQDCGIYVLANTENICNYFLGEGIVRHVPLLRRHDVDGKRQEILHLIRRLGGNVEDS